MVCNFSSLLTVAGAIVPLHNQFSDIDNGCVTILKVVLAQKVFRESLLRRTPFLSGYNVIHV